MANSLSQPRTAFHRRLQGISLELESGFGQVSTGFQALDSRLKTDLGVMNTHLGDLTQAVKAIPSTPGVASHILQVKVGVVLGDRPWEAIAVPVDVTLRDGIALMSKHDVRTLLLVDRKQIVVGMTTPSRLLAAVLDSGVDGPLKERMVPRDAFHGIDQIGALAEALKLFRHQRVKRLFVTDGKRAVIGILTLGMCLRWIAERLVEHSSREG